MAEESDGEGFRRLSVGVVLLACVLVLGYSVATDPILTENYGRDPGPAFQPALMLWLLAAGAAALVFDGLYRMWRSQWAGAVSLGRADRLIYPGAMVASLIAYALVVPYVGFFVTSVIFSAGWAMTLEAQDARRGEIGRLLVSAAESTFIAAVIYLVFERLIGIPLG
jgi:hypothetical protein